jgi:Icc-related predicted phosphoesterase
MRLLLFSDVHLNENHCRRLVKLSRQVDIVVGAGDYCSLRRNLDKVIGWLRPISTPTVLVPGNAESYDELVNACENWSSSKILHGNGVEIQGIFFYGLGGGIPKTPFGSWSWDFTEKQAENLLRACPENAILISHSPPKGILDRSSFGMHLGSKAVKQFMEEKSPQLIVCGHIHESGGKIKKKGKTTIINAGPAGIVFDLVESH